MSDQRPAGATGDDNQPDSSRAEWTHRHLWEIQPVRDLLLLAAVAGTLWLGSVLSLVTVPLLLAMLLAYLFEPVVARLTRQPWISRHAAAAIIIAGVVVLIVIPVTAGVAVATAQGVFFAERLATNVITLVDSVESPDDEALREQLPTAGWRRFRDQVVDWRTEWRRAADDAQRRDTPQDPAPPPSEAPDAETLGEEIESSWLSDAGEDLSTTSQIGALVYGALKGASDWIEENKERVGRAAIQTGAGIVNFVVGTLTSIGALFFTAFLTAFFFFFISTGWGKVLDFWESLIPERKRGRAIDLARQMDAVISGFVRGRLTIAGILSIYFIIAYTVVGTPASLVVGVCVGVISLVPYVALISIPVTILLMALDSSGPSWQNSWWWTVIAPVVVYQLGQTMDDYLLSPLIQGKSTNMDTPTILFASIAGGILAGVYGLLVAIPVAACAKILLREIVWPRAQQWARGEVEDPLPVGEPRKPRES